ncbi:MAG TPA: PEP/pyruvate-binding domain-containing protein [Spirochaetota bacterium]|nr:PEP/pyruvate-binding domain-containing protein [Spirochaetota bacterium]
MNRMDTDWTSGFPALDKALCGFLPGDNVVWQVEDIADYLPLARRFALASLRQGRRLVYFRFAQHQEVLPLAGQSIICTEPGLPSETAPPRLVELDPSDGFEPFLSSVFSVIEEEGYGVAYIFDCLSELSADWYSDRMLGNFFRLGCPYLFRYDTVAWFALLGNRHSSHAIDKIHGTAQVILDLYHTADGLFLLPKKAEGRRSPTLFTLHGFTDEACQPVTNSATAARVLSGQPQSWIDFSNRRFGPWTTAFLEAEEFLSRPDKAPVEIRQRFEQLVRMIFTRDQRLLDLARKYLELSHLVSIRRRMIGTGLIGGKSAGFILARAIIQRECLLTLPLEQHDSFFIGSDIYYTYMVDNDCWWVLRKQHDPETVLEGADTARERMLSGTFAPDLVNQFSEMLDYFGQTPLIVRSSSLLEDNYGNAFSGKYESVFCTNQGTPDERLGEFCEAVRRVYASTLSREALLYRADRGLLDSDEQMALLVQRVSGTTTNGCHAPLAAGVAYSFNPYVWKKGIDPAAGFVRLVAGLGTRAVDRSDDDHIRLVALDAPQAFPGDTPQPCQERLDILDLDANRFSCIDFTDISGSIPGVELVASLDQELARRAAYEGRSIARWQLDFEALLEQTEFVPALRTMLRTLEAAYGCPVDTEFALTRDCEGGLHLNLLQCRPFQARRIQTVNMSLDRLNTHNMPILSSGPVVGSGFAGTLARTVLVRPSSYAQLAQSARHEVARSLRRITRDGASGPVLLAGPGRWGSSMASLGVPVSFAEISGVTILVEIVTSTGSAVPEISLGTHFFNDLVEADMQYLVVTPDDGRARFDEDSFLRYPNALEELFPEYGALAGVIHLIEGVPLVCIVEPHEQRAGVFIS